MQFLFQSTHPTRECDGITPSNRRHQLDFNPRTLQESATRTISTGAGGKLFQSTHPTRECDIRGTQKVIINMIFQSTHPTRECDFLTLLGPYRKHTFQSTHPTRECDVSVLSRKCLTTYFNPRTLQESATSVAIPVASVIKNFNPRTLQESATNAV